MSCEGHQLQVLYRVCLLWKTREPLRLTTADVRTANLSTADVATTNMSTADVLGLGLRYGLGYGLVLGLD